MLSIRRSSLCERKSWEHHRAMSRDLLTMALLVEERQKAQLSGSFSLASRALIVKIEDLAAKQLAKSHSRKE